MKMDSASPPSTQYALYTANSAGSHFPLKVGFNGGKFEIELKNIDKNYTRTFTYVLPIAANKWNFYAVTWDGRMDNDPLLFINDAEVALSTSTAIDSTKDQRLLTVGTLVLFDQASSANGELMGSMANFAIWNRRLTTEQIKELHEIDNKALDVSYYSSLADYWKLGTETVLEGISVGSGIPNGTIVPSNLGRNNLTANDNLSASAGPYEVFTYEDVEKHDNMNCNSVLPRSDFQYSWIKNTLSGSKWLDKQKVRGYIPSSGEMVIVGNGALAKFESAVDWPLISDIDCLDCTDADSLPTITIKTPYQTSEAQGSTHSSPTSSLTLSVTNGAASSNAMIETEHIEDIEWSTVFNSCCPEDQKKYYMDWKGYYANGSQKAAYASPMTAYATPPSFPSDDLGTSIAPGSGNPQIIYDATVVAIDPTVYRHVMIKIKVECDGLSREFEIKLQKASVQCGSYPC